MILGSVHVESQLITEARELVFVFKSIPVLSAVMAIKKTAAPHAAASKPKRMKTKARPPFDPNEGVVASFASTDAFNINFAHYQRVSQAMDTIMMNTVFAGALNKQPLGIGDGGRQAPYSAADFLVGMQDAKSYKCGGNLFWVRPLKSAGFDRVPVNRKAVDGLGDYYFKTPSAFPCTIVVAVDQDEDPMKMKGSLERISPEEIEHALLLRIADRISQGADEDELRAWLLVALTVTIEFRLKPNSLDRVWEAVRTREELTTNYAMMARSAMQRVYEVIEFRAIYNKSHGQISNADLADAYNKKGRIATGDGQDEVSAYFVEQAISVHKHLLSGREARDLIMQADEKWLKHSPFNSITKLYLIQSKAKTSSNVAWVLASIIDAIDAGHLAISDCGARALQYPAGCSLLDFLLKKKDMNEYLLSTWLDQKSFDPQHKKTLRDTMSGHSMYRASCGFPHESDIDLLWQAGWPASVSMACAFIGELTYGTNHDASLKNGLRNSKPADEILSMGTIGERHEEINTQLEHEGSFKKTEIDQDQDAISDDEACAKPEVVLQAVKYKAQEIAMDAELSKMSQKRKDRGSFHTRNSSVIVSWECCASDATRAGLDCQCVSSDVGACYRRHRPSHFGLVLLD